MRSSSQGRDPFPKLLIFLYDMFWNTNLSRGGLFSNMLCSCKWSNWGFITVVHMLTIIQTFMHPVSPPQLLLVFLMAPPSDIWNTSRYMYVFQGVMLYVIREQASFSMRYYHNKLTTTHFLTVTILHSIYAGISRIRKQIWFLRTTSDEFLHYRDWRQLQSLWMIQIPAICKSVPPASSVKPFKGSV